MNKFQAGYAEVNINPPLGIGVDGYYIPRYASGFYDDITSSCLSLAMGEKKFLIISIDCCVIPNPLIERMKDAIVSATEILRENIIISATHTHTGPSLAVPAFPSDAEQVHRYVDFLVERIANLSVLSLNELKPAKMGYMVGHAPDRIAYIRRYKMKDGTTQTCPPINDPNIDHPIGELDQRVNVLRFDREGADSVVLLNYGLHADTVNGDIICSDWPGWTKRTLEKALDGTKCICVMGAQGDVGSTNVHPLPGDMNDTEISFDNEMKSWGMARFVGRALAGTVLQVYDKVAYIDVDDVEIFHKTLDVATNVPDKKDLPLAHKYKELHLAGRDDEIPFEAMELTTVVAEAMRMCALENGPYTIPLNMIGLRIGSVALVTVPGEPFTDVGVQIKDTPGWDMILPCALVNGYNGYFPMKSAFDEGGYEARTSKYKSGVAEEIIKAGKEILAQLKK